MPFSEFSLENVTLTRGTPPCAPHMEVPPPGFWNGGADILTWGIQNYLWSETSPPPPPPCVTFLFEDQ